MVTQHVLSGVGNDLLHMISINFSLQGDLIEINKILQSKVKVCALEGRHTVLEVAKSHI